MTALIFTSIPRTEKKDAGAESTLKDYVIEGVEFTYVKVGDINTESVNGNIKILYDIPPALEAALNLTDSRGDHKHTSSGRDNFCNRTAGWTLYVR